MRNKKNEIIDKSFYMNGKKKKKSERKHKEGGWIR